MGLSQQKETAKDAVFQLALTCNYNPEHIARVTWLSLQLFDGLIMLHHLSDNERFWLECAAILHDIGQIEGYKRHHKTSLQIILTNSVLPFDNKERLIIASVARYHRKALPDDSHDHFAALEKSEKEIVCILSACLRLADGLEQSSQGQITALTCKTKPRKITIISTVRTPPRNEDIAVEKSDLMERVFLREIAFRWVRET